VLVSTMHPCTHNISVLTAHMPIEALCRVYRRAWPRWCDVRCAAHTSVGRSARHQPAPAGAALPL